MKNVTRKLLAGKNMENLICTRVINEEAVRKFNLRNFYFSPTKFISILCLNCARIIFICFCFLIEEAVCVKKKFQDISVRVLRVV